MAEAAWQSVFATARNLDGWANCLTMAVESVGAVAPARVEEILIGMAAGGYIHRPEQEELLREGEEEVAPRLRAAPRVSRAGARQGQ